MSCQAWLGRITQEIVREARRSFMIQREAVGFRRHALATEIFAVPPPRPSGALGTGLPARQRSEQ
jgi:hypothetical protein